MPRMVDGYQDLDTAIEVARHQVGRPDQVHRLIVVVAVGEPVDPAVLEVAPQDAAHPDVLGQAGHAGAHRADAAHDALDLHPGVAGRVQRLDHQSVGDRVALQRDSAVGPERRLVLDQVDQLPLQVARCYEQGAVLLTAAVTGQVVEQLGDVGTDLVVARQESDVLVQPGGLGVVVAGPDVAVAAELVAVVAHDQDRLAVRLEPDHAVHHVHACPLELLGPLHVVGLVEPCLELDQHSDLLAALGGPDQAVDHGAVAARTVERHLDGLHAGIDRSLLQEHLHAAGEALVRVVHHDRPVAHHGEDRAIGSLGEEQPAGRHRRPGTILQIGSVEAVELPKATQVEHRPVSQHVAGVELEFPDE